MWIAWSYTEVIHSHETPCALTCRINVLSSKTACMTQRSCISSANWGRQSINMLVYNVIMLKFRKKHRQHVHVKYNSILFYICLYFTSQSDPFCDFKEGFQEEAADRGWTFTFTFHRSRVRATAERRLPQSHFEVSSQSRQCLHSSSTLVPPAPRHYAHLSIALFKC